MSSIDDYLEQLSNQHKTKQENINSPKTSSSSVNNPNSMNTSDNSDIDRYLSELEIGTKKNSPSKSSSNKPSKGNSNKDNNNTDNLLSTIENQYQSSQSSQVSSANRKKNSTDNLFDDLEAKFTQNKPNKNKTSSTESAIVDNSIQQILKQTNSKKQNLQQTKTVDHLSDIRQQELDKQREIKILERKAEEWLQSLNPESDEGFWFEQFAMSYESRFDAAIEYIKALSK